MKWLWGQIILVGFFCYAVDCYPADEDYPSDVDNKGPSQPPQVISQPTTFKVSEGESVILPCEVINKDADAALLWNREGNQSISADDHCFAERSICDNIELPSNGSLKIKSMTSHLGGRFICQYRNARVMHTVLVKPTVSIPYTRKTIEVGETLTLNCSVTGSPAPNVVWYRQSNSNKEPFTLGHEPILTISNVNESMSGIYTCKAFNEAVDNPESAAMKSVNVNIINGVAADSKVINAVEQTGPTNICCNFDKTKKVIWYKNDKELSEIGARYEIKPSKHKSCISIQKVKEDDVGKFTCKVVKDNGVIASDDILVIGIPLPPTLLSTTYDDNRNAVLEWKVKTISPITKYLIKIKKVEETTWKVYREGEGQEGQELVIKETFKDLNSGSYDVELEVHNRFGSSKYTGSASLIIDNPNYNVIAEKINSSATSLRISLLCVMSAAVTWFLSC